MKVFLLLALIAVAASHHVNFPEEDESQWELFKIEHEKVYSDKVEEHSRKEIFMRNLNFIRQHNAKYDNGEVTFRVGINRFADMTNQEFSKKMKGYKMPEGFVSEGDKFELDETLDLPKSVDWRTKGAVTPIKDQGQCGSCWAFSATGALEGQNFLKTKKMVSLSEQNLVDCSKENFGCDGGYIEKAFTFVKDNKGIDTEVSYPYEAHDDTCRFNKTTVGGTCTGYKAITSGSEKALQQAVAIVGPVSVAINANTDTFQFYESGVYWEPDCDPTKLDHAVLAIGYGTSKRGRDYWLVKNSWGTDWGMKGFILMSRNRKNMCGIATAASYPTV